MRALVTGASGFLGRHLVRHLIASGDEVVTLSRPWPAATALGGGRFDALFHLAWAGVHGAERRDPEQVTENLRHAAGVVELARAAGCAVLVGVGSQAEYGPRAGLIDEETPCVPQTPYGAAKLAAGALISALHERCGIRGVWLRLFSAYGPGDRDGYLIPYLIRELGEGRTPRLSAGEQPHDTLFCDDVAAALRAAAVSPSCSGTYVLASGVRTTVREIAETVRDMLAPGVAIDFGAPAGHPGWWGTSARLQRDAVWVPSTSLREGLRQTIACSRTGIGAAV